MPPRTRWTAAALAGLALLAFAARASLFVEVFGVHGETVLRLADGSYHARRALFSFVHFPALLSYDPYLAYPGGALVPMPPLYTWLLAALGRLLVSDEAGFARLLAWASPLFGMLTVPVVYAIGRSVGGRGAALGAAALFAVMPMAVRIAQVGDCDHHAFVALLASLALLSVLRVARPGLARGEIARWTALAVAMRVALALGWSGSLLYLAAIEVLLLAAAWLGDGRRLLVAQALGAGAAALLLVPWLAIAPTPAGGPFTTTTLSWFHAGALAAAAALSGLLRLALARPELLARRNGRILAGALAVLALAAAVALAAHSLAPGLAFLAKQDSWGARNPEQRALFSRGAATSRFAVPMLLFGLYGALLPFAWLAPLLRARGARGAPDRTPLLLLSGWLLAFAALACLQVRFGGDFVPAGCVGFALLLESAARRLPVRLCAPAALAAGVLLWLPGVQDADRRALAASFRLLRGQPPGMLSPGQSLALFGEAVRAGTPETSGYLAEDAHPEYGLLCRPGQGHAFLWTARRPTPAGNFGPYADPEKYQSVLRFYEGGVDEAEAYAIAHSLHARYVVTSERGVPEPTLLPDRLHAGDGGGTDGSAASEHFRLVLEGPQGGVPFPFMTLTNAYHSAVPYKLFEVVEGARLEIESAPDAALALVLDVRLPSGRGFRYRAVLHADAAGRASARVPYATERAGAAWAESARLESDGATLTLRISEAQVQRGEVVALHAR